MLRETRARWLATATAVIVIALAALFAWLRNWPQPAGRPPTLAEAATHDAARAAFERLNCALCHALGGRGNPSLPLDGIGGRRDAASIRDWTLGTGSARAQLPGGIAQMKERAGDDPDLDALIDYLVQQK